MPVEILIADDHVLFNDGLKSLVEGEHDLKICGQVFCGSEVLPFIQANHTDLILLDINLPRINGIDLIEPLKKNAPDIKIIIISMYTDKYFVDKVLSQGIPGYILKNASKVELLDAIRKVSLGEFYYDPKLKKDNLHAGDDFSRKFSLTRRELEILYMIKENNTNKQIADQLFLSLFTVETHRRNINLKLGINNPADLIHFIYKNNI
jgi:DNA-binding NarL/FixJ family response regulator